MKVLCPFFLFFTLWLGGCHHPPKRQFYPESVDGVQAAFYGSFRHHGVVDQKQEDLLFIFNKDGSYQGVLEDKFYEVGHFEYVLSKNSSEATLVLKHHQKNKEAISMFTLSYNSPYSGSWELVRSTNPEISSNKIGTFRFLR